MTLVRHKLKPKKQFYIYIHCRHVTAQYPYGEPFYVGKGHSTIKYSGRAYNLTPSHRVNPHHKHVVAKYGKENIIIYTRNCDSEQEAFEYERWMKKWCEAQGYRLTNLTDGGEGVSGYKNPPRSKEFCEAISKRMKGNQNMFGKKMPPRTKEWRTRHAALLSGRKQSKELIEKRVEGRKGYKHSEETKVKMRKPHTGYHYCG